MTLAWLNGSQLDRVVRHAGDGRSACSAAAGRSRSSARSPCWGSLGIVFCDGIWIVLSAAAAGLGAAVTFIVTFGLPAILSPPGEVHRMAGGMFTISYSIAVIVPISAVRLGPHRSALDGVPPDGAVRGMTIFGTADLRQSRHGVAYLFVAGCSRWPGPSA